MMKMTIMVNDIQVNFQILGRLDKIVEHWRIRWREER